MLRISSSIAKSKSLTSNLESQFQQRCSVSGTAKGKAKVKAGATLKRSKITVRKGGAAAISAPKEKSGGRNQEENVEELCLNAPTPIRYLSAKRRQIEAEREKLGLLSEDRKREIEMLKKQAKKGNDADEPSIVGTPGLDLITLGLVDVEKLPKYELTVEDGRKLAKEYSRVLMRKHRARQSAETMILRLKKEAIEALPEHLKAAALVPDLTPFPANRFMATLTPPIEGYIEKVMEAAKKRSGKSKLR